MKEIVSTLTSNGRVTISAEIRKQRGLDAGAKIAFVFDDGGNVSMRPLTYPRNDRAHESSQNGSSQEQ